MSQVQTQQQVSPGATGAPPPALAGDRRPAITPIAAGWFGAALMGSAIICILLINIFNPSHSLGSAALTGTAVVSTGLVALIVLSRAVGIVQPAAALGLPNGSVRALLAVGLAIVFVAVASWILGGLFDPLGQQISEVKIPTNEIQTIIDQYRGDFFIGRTSVAGSSPPEEIVKIFLKRTVQNDVVLDLAKQILTITATVLVTVVGFYFGSKSSSDAVQTIQATLLNSRTASGVSSPYDAATAVARDIAAMSDDATKKMVALGADPMGKLADMVRGASVSVRDTLSKPLSDAQQHFDDIKAAQAEVNAVAERAAAVSSAMKADAADGDLQQARDQLISLRTRATDSKRDADAALTAFVMVRDLIIAGASKG